MENIKIIDGEIYETHDVKIDLDLLEFQVEEMQKSIDNQQDNVDALKQKILDIKEFTLQNGL